LTAARTDRIRNGKIFVHHVADAIRIRNEEHAAAI
jgi:nitrogen regulatory protein PII